MRLLQFCSKSVIGRVKTPLDLNDSSEHESNIIFLIIIVIIIK